MIKNYVWQVYDKDMIWYDDVMLWYDKYDDAILWYDKYDKYYNMMF